ncbi:MAG: FAD-dependent oxidoreductase, partial [Lentisphaeria bacterium]|nr:FAD-dependent oxidoreductase [Lentisphaeria bacterium]
MQPAPRRFPAAFAAGLCLLAAGSLAAPLSGPILDLGFDSFHGTTTPDASGRGNDGLVIAGLQVKGVRGTALDFSLPNASVMCDATGSLELPGPLSLEAWVCTKGTATGSFGTVIRKEEAYALRFNGSQIGLLLWMNGKVHYLHSPPLDIRPGAWMHLAGTFDGQAMRLYVDGREVPSSPQPLEGTVDRSGAPCCIGSCRGGNAFQGLVDEARVYARALAPAEISDAHAAGLEALAREQAVVVEPREIGERPQPFRKPPREIRAVVPGFLWVDAEDFAEYGGWVLDTQFVHLMGSAYLLAAGVGTPVSDAGTRLDLPEAGRYRVWVRTRNWSPPHAPGQFLVRVDDRPLPRVFGKVNSGAWTWESGGECDLAAGTHSLALRDMTGYYGRCDAMLLTTDLQYVPPEGSEDVCRERARLCGFSLDPEPAGDFDVIVVGAGSAGFPAALASARLGSRTALIQNRPVLGGNASRECGVPLNGAASGHPNARETGIAEEVGRVRARHGYRSYSEPFRLLADEEPRLEVFTNRHVFAVTMASPTRIASVRAVDTLTGRVSEYTARQFVDCTGDGWVGYFAKAEFRLGRESRDEFDEDLAPAEADSQTMSGCLMGNGLGFRAADSGAPAPFVRPPWAREIPELEGPGRKLRSISGGEWWLEHPNTIDDIWQAEEARDELIKIAFSYWDWIRSRSRMREQAANYALQHIPIMDAKRESRRLVGDYILNQRDCQEGRVFPDRIAYGGWPLDVHHAEGIFSGAGGSFHCNARVPIYTIPYRCLYSRNLENLLFAGRCASVSHIALGSIRVQSTLATLGQAAGTAAALCNALGTTPRGIYRDHIGVLQQLLLKNDQTIPGIRNEDPADLARTATATASSTAAVVLFSAADIEREAGHPLD